jgi:hypothetical protein
VDSQNEPVVAVQDCLEQLRGEFNSAQDRIGTIINANQEKLEAMMKANQEMMEATIKNG